MTVQDGNNTAPDPRRGTLGQFIERATPIQIASILVFIILSAAIGVVGIFMINGAVQSDTGYKVLAVFVPITLASALFAWLDNETLKLFAAGIGALLDVHRAALAAFIAAGLAAIAVSLFVALSSLFADGPEDGVFALAAIEFLLKLAAVSAIIVLITLRRDKDAGGDQVADQGNGKLEFGTIAFAFSLVIIAALIVPRDDLLRFGSMFFGGEKRLEDYLPTRPVAKVEQGLKSEIRVAVVSAIAQIDELQSLPMPELERKINITALEGTIFSVLAGNLMRQTERRGALPLLKAVCDNIEDTLIFSHSDNRTLAEHLDFLSSEGLVEYPYGDPRNITITRYGADVLKSNTGRACASKAYAALDAPVQPVTPAANDSPKVANREIRSVPFEESVGLSETPTIFEVNLPTGQYRAELIAEGGSADPVLQLTDADDRRIDGDDDGGPGILDAGLSFTSTGSLLKLKATNYLSLTGSATLRVRQIGTTGAVFCDLRRDAPAFLQGATVAEFGSDTTVPVGCSVFIHRPTKAGEAIFEVGAEGDADLVAALLEVDPVSDERTTVTVVDDTPEGTNPVVRAQLEADHTYYLLVGYTELPAALATATVVVTEPTADAEPPAETQQTEPSTPSATPPAEPTDGQTTVSPVIP